MKKFIIFIIFQLNAIAFGKVGTDQQIEDIISRTDRGANIGIKITNLDKGVVIYEKNSQRYFNFASGLKFITLGALLNELGPDYRFDSTISVKNDDYYLDIHDPDFSSQDLEILVQTLKNKNINLLKGNFYIVKRDFLLPPLARGKTVGDTVYCNSGPITRVHVNQNCVRVNIQPSEIGKKPQISETEIVPYVIVNNSVATGDNNQELIYTAINDNKYVISGTLNKSGSILTIGAVANDNFNHVNLMLEHLLRKHVIQLKGKILTSNPPIGAAVVAVKNNNFFAAASKAMKKSDNFMTDYLLAEASGINQRLLQEINGRQMEWRDAGRMVKVLACKHFGVDIDSSVIEDGCGISRINLLQINQVDSILRAWSKKPNFSMILAMLAKPGETGTIKDRYTENTRIYAKTGGLMGVTSLLGYFYNNKNELHSFVIVTNNIYGSIYKYRRMEDEIIKLFIEEKS